MFNLKVNDSEYKAKAILFDKDGTLIDLKEMWGSWLRVSSTILKNMIEDDFPEIQSVDFTLFRECFDNKSPLAVGGMQELYTILTWQIYQSGISWVESKAIMEKSKVIIDYEMNRLKPVIPTKGLLKFLEDCYALQIPLAIVTSDNEYSAVRHMGWLGASKYFNSILGRDSTSKGKPNPEVVELACRKLGVSPEEVILIGDTEMDMKLGKNSGVLATIGFNDLSLTGDELIMDYSTMTVTR